MTSSLSFSSRLCSKPLKRLSYDCQCLLTHVCLLCMSKIHRWKFFHCLRGFLWQFTQVYLSVKWVINPSPHIQLLFFFLLQLLHSQLLYVKSFLIEYVSTDYNLRTYKCTAQHSDSFAQLLCQFSGDTLWTLFVWSSKVDRLFFIDCSQTECLNLRLLQ